MLKLIIIFIIFRLIVNTQSNILKFNDTNVNLNYYNDNSNIENYVYHNNNYNIVTIIIALFYI